MRRQLTCMAVTAVMLLGLLTGCGDKADDNGTREQTETSAENSTAVENNNASDSQEIDDSTVAEPKEVWVVSKVYSYGDPDYPYYNIILYAYEYDERGNCIAQLEYNQYSILEGFDESRQISQQVFYDYDDAGNLLSQRIYDMSDVETPFERVEYECDSSGRITKETTYYRGQEQPAKYVEYTYDDKSNVIRETKHYLGDDESTAYQKYGYEYDESGKIMKKLDYLDESMIGECYIYEYDDLDNVIKITRYMVADFEVHPESISVIDYTTYEYDEFGNLLIETYCRSDDSIITGYRYEYITVIR